MAKASISSVMRQDLLVGSQKCLGRWVIRTVKAQGSAYDLRLAPGFGFGFGFDLDSDLTGLQWRDHKDRNVVGG